MLVDTRIVNDRHQLLLGSWTVDHHFDSFADTGVDAGRGCIVWLDNKWLPILCFIRINQICSSPLSETTAL